MKLWTMLKYNMGKYLNYFIVLYYIAYSKLEKYKDNTFLKAENKIILNVQKEYK